MQTAANHFTEDAALENSPLQDAPVFLAGHSAPAGTYRLIGTSQEVCLDQEDILPATCDGHIAVYERRPQTWAERQRRPAGTTSQRNG